MCWRFVVGATRSCFSTQLPSFTSNIFYHTFQHFHKIPAIHWTSMPLEFMIHNTIDVKKPVSMIFTFHNFTCHFWSRRTFPIYRYTVFFSTPNTSAHVSLPALILFINVLSSLVWYKSSSRMATRVLLWSMSEVVHELVQTRALSDDVEGLPKREPSSVDCHPVSDRLNHS